MDKLDDTNFEKKKVKNGKGVGGCQDIFKKALQGKAFHKEAKVNCEMMELELRRVLLDVETLVKEKDNIRF